MTVYALNGLGRIGKLALRPLLERGAEIAWINDAVGDPALHAHLLEFDSVHGRWDAVFGHDAGGVSIDGRRLPFVGTGDLASLPREGVDVVIDCTGVFKSEARLAPYFEAGVERVVVSAPVKDGWAANIVYGVNHGIFDPARHRVVTAASCTTNCLAPVVKVLHEGIGIRHGSITTSTPSSGSAARSPVPTKGSRRPSMVTPPASWPIAACQRPCTLSNSSRWACRAGSPTASLIQAISAPRSSSGRKASLPIRPSPLSA